VNAWIEANEAGRVRHMGYREALDGGAVALFGEKYGDEVRVVSFGGVSTELCGGTHARATGDIGLLKIVSETGIAAGVRRIEALTGLGALRFLREQQRRLRRAGELLRVPAEHVPERIEKLLEERRATEREISDLRRGKGTASAAKLADAAERVGDVAVLATRQDGLPARDLRAMVDDLRDQLGSGIVLLASEHEGKLSLALGVTPDLKGRFKAGDLVREVAAVVGGRGGGRPDFAQAGASDASRLAEAFARLRELVAEGS
jgi:alanyl-tRNA synthetase